MITITLVDNGTKRYAMVTTGTILGRMYDNNAETITVVKPASEVGRTCTMIVTAASSGCFAAKTIDEIEVGNDPVSISNALSQYSEVKIGFSFSDDTGYVKNSEVQTFKFLEAQKPDNWQPDDSEIEYKVEQLIHKGFVDVGWSTSAPNTLVFKNVYGEIVDEIELSPFVQEQSNLAETDNTSETFVRNKSTKYLENEGEDGSSPYATKEYVDQNTGAINTIKVNGVEQQIVDKAVDITVPTQTSDLTNNGDGTDNNSPFATKKYVQDNGGKIDTIKVNGVTQTITNKAVDIAVPTATSDLTNDSGFIDNTVNDLTNYTDTTTLNNTLNKVVQSNTGVTVSGDNVSLSKSFVNVGTGATSSDTTAIPLATDETGGLMSSSDYAQIRENTEKIAALEGKTTRLFYPYTINASDITISDTTTLQIGSILKEGSIVNGATLLEDTTITVATSLVADDKIATGSTIVNGSIVNGASYPTATQINAFVVALGYTSPFEGIAVVTNVTYHIWHYYENNGIGWKDDGVDTVSQFTNDYAGVIQGSATDGKVYAETDGTGSVYGWDTLKNRVTDVEQNKASITQLNTKQDTLVSGTNIKTINGNSILGSGNLDVGIDIVRE